MARAAPALLALAVLAGCIGAAEDAPDVVASFYPLAWAAERIAGTHLDVAQLVPAGVEPHDWEPSARDVARVAGARLLVLQGAGFDAYAGDIVTDLGRRGPMTVSTTAALDLRETEGAPDPHTWLDPVLFAAQTNAVAGGLFNAWNELADDFAPAHAALAADLDALDREYSAGLAECDRRVIVSSHDAFSYVAARYNFTVLAITGLSPEAEPDPRTLSELADAARAANVTVVFFEELVSPRVAEVLAEELGATTRVLSPIETLTPEAAAAGKDYLALARDNLANLREAMGCR